MSFFKINSKKTLKNCTKNLQNRSFFNEVFLKKKTSFFFYTDIEFLQKILRLWENDECLEVNSVVQTPACGPGENMMSVVDRIVVNGTRKDQSRE